MEGSKLVCKNVLFSNMASNVSQATSQKSGKKKSIFAQQFAHRSLSDFGMRAQKPMSTQSATEITKQSRQTTKFGKFQFSPILHFQQVPALKRSARLECSRMNEFSCVHILVCFFQAELYILGDIGERSYILTGKGLIGFGGESEAQKIHRENVDKLTSMSSEEIMKEREQLLTSLGNETAFKKSLQSLGYNHFALYSKTLN